ncbi:MAG: tetratricopeptide repeat protein [Parvibaculaceae bacterium]|nr:tetratricopeptide repeat protein [Parvibaculaceae bacterium]
MSHDLHLPKRSFAHLAALLVVSALIGVAGHTAPTWANAIDDNNDCYDQFRGGDNRLAIYYCSRAIQSGELDQPDLVAALINRGVAYKNTGNLVMAVVDYTSALEIAPKDAVLWANRANAHREMEQLNPALSDINKALELNPERATSYYVRGVILEARGELEAAQNDFLKAHELQPQNTAFKQKAGK